jgi:hypothetical protein
VELGAIGITEETAPLQPPAIAAVTANRAAALSAALTGFLLGERGPPAMSQHNK